MFIVFSVASYRSYRLQMHWCCIFFPGCSSRQVRRGSSCGIVLPQLLASWASCQEAWVEQASVHVVELGDGQVSSCMSALDESMKMFQSPVFLIHLYMLQLVFCDCYYCYYVFCYFLLIDDERR